MGYSFPALIMVLTLLDELLSAELVKAKKKAYIDLHITAIQLCYITNIGVCYCLA